MSEVARIKNVVVWLNVRGISESMEEGLFGIIKGRRVGKVSVSKKEVRNPGMEPSNKGL